MLEHRIVLERLCQLTNVCITPGLKRSFAFTAHHTLTLTAQLVYRD